MTVRWSLALIVLAGCDQLFDLRTVDENAPTGDGGGGSGTVDARCPAIGKGPPVYRTALNEVLARNCITYTVSTEANRAIAFCNDAPSGISEGPIDGALSLASIAVSPAGDTIERPALAPEGDVMYVKQRTGNTLASRITSYVRSGSQWVFEQELASEPTELYVGAPSAGPERRIMISINRFDANYRELAEVGGTWIEVRSGNWSDIVPDLYLGISPHLSVDGLRLTFIADQGAYYADRASLDMPFGRAVPIAAITKSYDVFLTPDCGRAYHSAAGSVVYRTLVQ